MSHPVPFLVAVCLSLVACGGDDEGAAVPPGPELRTELDETALDFVERRRVTSEEQLLTDLESARERIDALADAVTSRPEEEHDVLEQQLSAMTDRMAALDDRAAELREMEQMDWERSHDSLRADLRGLRKDLLALEARLR